MAKRLEAQKDRAAAPAGPLRYSLDDEPGIARAGDAHGFEYRHPSGRLVKDAATLARIRSLAIPPAWQKVWVCRDPRGHLQATGRDARGRKQYRYHPRWRARREADKFDHLSQFAAVLPAIRRRTRADLALPGLPRRKVMAAIVRLLETTCFRIGNERYAEENDSFGLTTLRNRHAKVAGDWVEIQFRGKSGKFHRAEIHDERLARIVRRCRELPGQALFTYLDEEGRQQAVGSSDVNEYLRDIARADVTAKDFRTWAGTVHVANELARREGPVGPSHMVAAVRAAAHRLGNTPAICRKSYVHPRLLDPRTWERARRMNGSAHPGSHARRGLRAEEAAVLRLLAPLRASSTSPRPRPTRSRPSPSATPDRR